MGREIDPRVAEFIVSYCPDSCKIVKVYSDWNDSMAIKETYEEALMRKKSDSYGSIVSFNNQWHASVMASNAAEAFDIFKERFIKMEESRRQKDEITKQQGE